MKTGFLADLFTTVCNCHWDLARIMSAIAFVGFHALVVHNIASGQPVTPNEYGEALLKLVTGCVAFIGGKDLARRVATKGLGAS